MTFYSMIPLLCVVYFFIALTLVSEAARTKGVAAIVKAGNTLTVPGVHTLNDLTSADDENEEEEGHMKHLLRYIRQNFGNEKKDEEEVDEKDEKDAIKHQTEKALVEYDGLAQNFSKVEDHFKQCQKLQADASIVSEMASWMKEAAVTFKECFKAGVHNYTPYDRAVEKFHSIVWRLYAKTEETLKKRNDAKPLVNNHKWALKKPKNFYKYALVSSKYIMYFREGFQKGLPTISLTTSYVSAVKEYLTGDSFVTEAKQLVRKMSELQITPDQPSNGTKGGEIIRQKRFTGLEIAGIVVGGIIATLCTAAGVIGGAIAASDAHDEGKNVFRIIWSFVKGFIKFFFKCAIKLVGSS